MDAGVLELEQDAATIFNTIGLEDVTLAVSNGSIRGRDYREYYDDASAARVAELYARDIEALGFSF